jgi:hypothetical protein
MPPLPPHAQMGLLAGFASAALVLFVLILRRPRSTSGPQWSEDMVDKAARAASSTAAPHCMAHTCEACTRSAHPGRCSRWREREREREGERECARARVFVWILFVRVRVYAFDISTICECVCGTHTHTHQHTVVPPSSKTHPSKRGLGADGHDPSTASLCRPLLQSVRREWWARRWGTRRGGLGLGTGITAPS